MPEAAIVQEAAAAAAAHYPACACVCVCRWGVFHTADPSHVGCIIFGKLALRFVDDGCAARGQNGAAVYAQPLPVALGPR